MGPAVVIAPRLHLVQVFHTWLQSTCRGPGMHGCSGKCTSERISEVEIKSMLLPFAMLPAPNTEEALLHEALISHASLTQQTDRCTDGWTERWTWQNSLIQMTDRQTNGRTDGQTDGQMDRQTQVLTVEGETAADLVYFTACTLPQQPGGSVGPPADLQVGPPALRPGVQVHVQRRHAAVCIAVVRVSVLQRTACVLDHERQGSG